MELDQAYGFTRIAIQLITLGWSEVDYWWIKLGLG